MFGDPQLAELEAHYERIDEWDRVEAARFDAEMRRLESTPRRVRCSSHRCRWSGIAATHQVERDGSTAPRRCPVCQRRSLVPSKPCAPAELSLTLGRGLATGSSLSRSSNAVEDRGDPSPPAEEAGAQ